MKRILVFRTSVESALQVKKLKPLLDGLLQEYESWNFDLEDCDRILRIESARLSPVVIVNRLEREGFKCVELEV